MEHMKKALPFVLGGAVIAVFLFFFLRGGDPQAALGDDIRLVVYTASEKPTGGAALSLPFIKDNESAEAVNAAVDIDGDGVFSEAEWIVRNESPRVFADYRNNFNFSADGIETSRTYRARILLSKELIGDKAEFDAGKAKELEVAAEEHKMPVSFYVDPSGEMWFGGAGGEFSAAPVALAQGGEPLDVFVPDVPNFPQGVNECGPVSVANGITYLVDKNASLDEFAEEFGGNIFDAIEELKQDMGHNPERGVRPGSIVPGKEAFTERHNLPIVTETISFPTVDRIADALKSGAAVEVGMSLGGAGHIVTAVGVKTNADGSVDLQVHDGATANGMESLDLTGDVEVETPDGTATAQGIRYPHWQGQPQFINWIIIERWATPESEEQTGVAPETGDNPYTDADRPSEVEMLVLAPNEYYPKYQFIVADPDAACSARHYHKPAAAYGIWINPEDPYDFRPVSRADPAPTQCGFGAVSAVPVQMKWITWDMSAELLKNLIGEEPQSGGRIEIRGLEGLRGN